MLRKKLTLIALSLLLTNIICAQFFNDTINFKKSDILLKTSPLAILQGPILFTSEYRIAYEYSFIKNISMQLSGSYLGKSPMLYIVESVSNPPFKFTVTGFRFMVEWKYYFNKELFDKFYIGPQYSYSYAKITDKYSSTFNDYIKAVYTNYSLKIGYQFILDNVCIDIYYGLGYRDNQWIEHINQNSTMLDNEDFELYKGNLKVILGFNVGFVY